VEYRWLETIRRCELFVYQLPADTFTPVAGKAPHAVVSKVPVTPLGPPEPVGDLLTLHEKAGIELRLLHNLWPWWDRVLGTTVGYSGIRLANARAR
jgi:hypothetical protein